MVILCEGPPGTGKSMTTQAVAAYMNRPVIYLQRWANQDENFLERAFSLATRWNLVVQIDEAESFLAKRTSDRMQENGLVATMLRQVEKAACVMVLTTNRPFDIDEAAADRIHLHFIYNLPDVALRRQIWVNTLPKEMPIDGDREAFLDTVSTIPLNGRQIYAAILQAASIAAKRNLLAVPVDLLLENAKSRPTFKDGVRIGFWR